MTQAQGGALIEPEKSREFKMPGVHYCCPYQFNEPYVQESTTMSTVLQTELCGNFLTSAKQKLSHNEELQFFITQYFVVDERTKEISIANQRNYVDN